MSGEWDGPGEPSSSPSDLAAAAATVEPPIETLSSTDGEPPVDEAAGADGQPPPDPTTTATAPEAEPVAPEAEAHGPGHPEDQSCLAVDAGPSPNAAGATGGEATSEIPPPPEPDAEVVRSDTFVASTAPPPWPVPAPTPTPEVGRRSRRRRSDRARHRKSTRKGVKTIVVLVVLVVLGGSAVGAARVTATLPLATVSQSVPSARLVGGSQHPLSWPTGVQAALAVPSLGVSRDSGPERPAPVASLTKMMTAHIVLADHPLTPTQDGPSITITPDDVANEVEDENTDQANIQVAAGEVLTERQMLEGMLIHSANNFADLLAEWDAGSIPAFVVKMNAAAHSLGMTQTSYTDASGFSTQTVSTPADQLKLASVLIQNQVVAQIVDNTSVTLPVAGTVVSYTPLIGVDDVVGVKSGFTSAAGGCDVLALSERVDGVPIEVLAAVSGYQGSGSVLAGAGLEALSVARQAIAQLRSVQVLTPGEQVAVARSAGYSAPIVARSGVSVLVWPGQQITERLTVDRPPPSGAKAGWRVGSITAQVGVQEQTVTVATSSALPTPSFFQRVF